MALAAIIIMKCLLLNQKLTEDMTIFFMSFLSFFLVFVDIAKMENHLENYNLTVI